MINNWRVWKLDSRCRGTWARRRELSLRRRFTSRRPKWKRGFKTGGWSTRNNWGNWTPAREATAIRILISNALVNPYLSPHLPVSQSYSFPLIKIKETTLYSWQNVERIELVDSVKICNRGDFKSLYFMYLLYWYFMGKIISRSWNSHRDVMQMRFINFSEEYKLYYYINM